MNAPVKDYGRYPCHAIRSCGRKEEEKPVVSYDRVGK